MQQFNGDPVQKLAYRLASAVGTRCHLYNPDQAAEIVGEELNEFLEHSLTALTGLPLHEEWGQLVQRCIDRVNRIDAYAAQEASGQGTLPVVPKGKGKTKANRERTKLLDQLPPGVDPQSWAADLKLRDQAQQPAGKPTQPNTGE